MIATELHDKSSIGARLRSERERLGLGQLELAEAGGVNRNSQGAYEKGERLPDAGYLAAAAVLGVDALYVITGVRQQSAGLSPEQSQLLEYFGAADSHAQDAALTVLEALARLEPEKRAPLRPRGADVQLSQAQWEAELWRGIARAVPTTPGAAVNERLTPAEFVALVDKVFEVERKRRSAESLKKADVEAAAARALKKR